MKLNSSIYLVSESVKFNPEGITKFGSFDTLHSLQLYSALVLNHEEIFSDLFNSKFVHYCFDEKDKEFLPGEFLKSSENLIFGEPDNKQKLFRTLSEKYFPQYNKNLLVFSNSIGITPEDIQRAFNLLSVEDEAVVIGKTNNFKIAFIGLNFENPDFLFDMDLTNLNYDNLLYKINQHDIFVHVLGNYMLIENTEDFKNLYAELSKKESLAYCSQKMHERFTNLFIEYKELLK